MDRPEITRLYRYRSFDEFSLSSLIDHTGWFASPSSFNDPFDCGITLSDSKLDDSVRHALQDIQAARGSREWSADDLEVTELDRQAYITARQSLVEAVQSLGIFCLSEISDNVLMWAHYANNHCGFCIEYGRQPDNSLGRLAEPVDYSDEYPEIGFLDIISDSKRLSPSKMLWLSKSCHWSYEREWRIIQGAGNKLFRLDFPVTGIIFGMRMPDAQRRTLHNIVASRWPAAFWQANRSLTSFQVELTQWTL